MIVVTGIEPFCRTHKRACDVCGYMKPVIIDGQMGLDAGVTMEAAATFQIAWGQVWKVTVWSGQCERPSCREEHRGELIQYQGVAP